MANSLKFQNIAKHKQITRAITPTLGQELRDYLLYFLRVFIVIALIYIFVRTSLFDLIGVSGQSMFPNYNENTKNDVIFIDQLTPKFSNYKRGDVIILIAPEQCDSAKSLYIKRVIGLPGEQVVFEGGKVFIINDEFPNGVELDESSYLPSTTRTYKRANSDDGLRFEEPVVPEGEYYFLGDNRTGSADSRVCGTITKGQVLGKEFFRLTPPEKNGFYEGPIYNITNQVF